MYIEIGQIQSQNFGQISLDSAGDLAGILNLEFKVNANIFKSTTKILEISITNEDKNLIKQNLEKSVEFIINKHKEKAKFYENVIMSKQVGDIEIDKNQQRFIINSLQNLTVTYIHDRKQATRRVYSNFEPLNSRILRDRVVVSGVSGG